MLMLPRGRNSRTTNNLKHNIKINKFKISIHECSFLFRIENTPKIKNEKIFSQIAKIWEQQKFDNFLKQNKNCYLKSNKWIKTVGFQTEVSFKMMIGEGGKQRGVLLWFFVFDILLSCFWFGSRNSLNFTSKN